MLKLTPLVPVKFKRFYKEYRTKTFTLLDVGCGNHGPSATKKWFDRCIYHGIDRGIYNNSQHDMVMMDRFYQLDLGSQSLDGIPDNYFDVIIASHILEHLRNGLSLLESLAAKAKNGGKIYIEYPSVRTLSFPRTRASLHFCDDVSHVRLYSVKEIGNTLLDANFRIIKAGVRRDPAGIICLPAIILLKWLRKEPLTGFGLWDILGFAEYVYAEKQGDKI